MQNPQICRFAALALLAGLAIPATALAQCPPARPQNVSATDGLCDHIFINWSDVSGADVYFVYRNTSNNYATSSLAGTVFSSQMDDNSAARGQVYYYWVVAKRTLCLPGSGSSSPSVVTTGHRSETPRNPENVNASDGDFCGGVRVTWTQSEPTLGFTTQTFRIYRNTVNLYLTSSEIGTAGGTRRWFFDTTAAPGETYYYWVRAENPCGTNASSGDAGSRSAIPASTNDLCTGALPLTPGSPRSGSTTCAHGEVSETCNSGEFSPDLWYRYTAPADGELTVFTCGLENFDTVLAVYENACPSPTPSNLIACNDDGCGFRSRVVVPVSANASYFIRVAGYHGASGVFSIESEFTPAGGEPCYANCDESTVQPVLNVADFTCFLQRFSAGSAYANCDESTVQPVLNVADFTCFLQQFSAGCP